MMRGSIDSNDILKCYVIWWLKQDITLIQHFTQKAPPFKTTLVYIWGLVKCHTSTLHCFRSIMEVEKTRILFVLICQIWLHSSDATSSLADKLVPCQLIMVWFMGDGRKYIDNYTCLSVNANKFSTYGCFMAIYPSECFTLIALNFTKQYFELIDKRPDYLRIYPDANISS